MKNEEAVASTRETSGNFSPLLERINLSMKGMETWKHEKGDVCNFAVWFRKNNVDRSFYNSVLNRVSKFATLFARFSICRDWKALMSRSNRIEVEFRAEKCNHVGHIAKLVNPNQWAGKVPPKNFFGDEHTTLFRCFANSPQEDAIFSLRKQNEESKIAKETDVGFDMVTNWIITAAAERAFEQNRSRRLKLCRRGKKQSPWNSGIKSGNVNTPRFRDTVSISCARCRAMETMETEVKHFCDLRQHFCTGKKRAESTKSKGRKKQDKMHIWPDWIRQLLSVIAQMSIRNLFQKWNGSCHYEVKLASRIVRENISRNLGSAFLSDDGQHMHWKIQPVVFYEARIQRNDCHRGVLSEKKSEFSPPSTFFHFIGKKFSA